MNWKPEIVLRHQCVLGEGPLWDERKQRILWVDIFRGELHQYTPLGSQNKVYRLGEFVSSVNICESGELLLTLHKRLAFLKEFSDDWKASYLDIEEVPESTRFNDAKCDAAGNLWAGTMDLPGNSGGGKLLMLDQNLQVSVKIPEVGVSNGMAWSEDQLSFYYIDTSQRNVVVYDYDPSTFNIRNKRTIIEIPAEMGKPDGMTIDQEGMLWIAMWNGGKVTRWDPDKGICLLSIPLPVSQVTSCTFGGEHLEDLYITTAQAGLSDKDLEKEPLAGALFVIKDIGIKGTPAALYNR